MLNFEMKNGTKPEQDEQTHNSSLGCFYDDLDDGADWAEIERQKQEDSRRYIEWEKRHEKEFHALEEADYVDEHLKLYKQAQAVLCSPSATDNETRQAFTIDNLNKRLSSLENINLKLRKENSALKTEVKNLNPLDNPYKPAGGFVQVGKWFVHEYLTKQEELKKLGLKNADLGILLRLLPLIGYNHNILHDPMSQIPFNTEKQLADYLGDNQSIVRGSLARIIKAGLITRINGLFVANEDYLMCGQISQRTRDSREKCLITKKLPRNPKRGIFRAGSSEHEALAKEKERRDQVIKN